MKGGAIEFLTKPFRDQDLLDAVETGLARDRVHREQKSPRMPLQYAEKINAARSGMARAAEKAARDSITE